jgi:hypothetical protein
VDYRNHNLSAVTALGAGLGAFSSGLFVVVTVSRVSVTQRAALYPIWAAFGGVCAALVVAALLARGRTGPRTRHAVIVLLLAAAGVLSVAILRTLPLVRTSSEAVRALFDHPMGGLAGVAASVFLAWWWWRLSERG